MESRKRTCEMNETRLLTKLLTIFMKSFPVEPVSQISPFILLIPKEIWLNDIFIYFDTKTKKKVRSVCKTFYHLINESTKWSIRITYIEEYLKFYENNISRKEEEWKPAIYQIETCYTLFNNYTTLKKTPSCVKSLHFNSSNITNSHLFYLPPSLEKLVFYCCSDISNEGIKNLPSSLKSLQIRFPYRNVLTSELIYYLPKGLNELEISGINLNNEDIKELPSSLTKLSLGNQSSLTNKGFQYLSNYCLKSLKLTDIANLNEEGLKILPPSITKLSITNCSNMNDNILKYLPSNLIQLNLFACKCIAGIGFQYLPSSLQKLEIDGSYLTDEGMKILHNITAIQSLNLHYNKNISNEGLKYLPLSLTSLCIYFTNAKITPECLLFLPSTLLKLDIQGSFSKDLEINNETFRKLPPSIKHLTLYKINLKNVELNNLSPIIKSLILDNCKLNKETIKSLPPGLSSLYIDSCEEVDDKYLISLPSTLTSLSISHNYRINGECIQHFPSSLTHLKFSFLTFLKNGELRSLPSTIQDLELRQNESLTDECLDFLPTTLISLKIAFQKGMAKEKIEEWKKKYKVY